VPGMYVDEFSSAQRRVREVGDILAHSAKKFFGQDEEVDTWVKGLGGMRKLDELLVGKDRLKQYIADLREVKAETGFIPSVLGAPTQDMSVDSATDYSSYAVLAHRETLTKVAHGEVEENKFSDPSWEGHESNPSSKPFWWNNIYMGKSSRQKANEPKFMAKGVFRFKQVPTSSPWNSKRVDFRIGGIVPLAAAEHPFFTRFCDMGKDDKRWKSLVRDFKEWFLNEDHKMIKDLTDRFYNDPKSLMWFMDPYSYGDMSRLCCGTRTSTGDIIWVPLSRDAQKSFDWWLENEGKEPIRFYCRALYHGEWILAYRKSRKPNHINVRKFKVCSQTGWLAKWKDVDMHFSDWGKLKEKMLKLGANDAYFGKPGTPGEYKKAEKPSATL
jgi:hypothetical protein